MEQLLACLSNGSFTSSDLSLRLAQLSKDHDIPMNKVMKLCRQAITGGKVGTLSITTVTIIGPFDVGTTKMFLRTKVFLDNTKM